MSDKSDKKAKDAAKKSQKAAAQPNATKAEQKAAQKAEDQKKRNEDGKCPMFKLEVAMKALEGREEFVVKKKDGKVIINYLITLPDSFVGIRENFRGVTFDEVTGEIVSLPLHKFYNVNQKDHTQVGLIGDMTCRVFEKFDGTMCHALMHNGDVVLASRMGWDTEQAVAATKLLNKLGLKTAVASEIADGRTPIFEYVGPSNPIVLHYAKEDLVYLWSRDYRTGEYSRRPGMSVDNPHAGRLMTVKGVMEEVLSLEDKEGYVCVLENGMWVKAKCQWYLDRHRAFDMLMKPTYRIYEVGLEGNLDDLISQCADLYKPKLEEILVEVGKDQIRLHRELQNEYDALLLSIPASVTDHERRKSFAIAAKPSPNFSGLMSLYAGKPCDVWVNARLFEHYKTKYPGRLFATLPDEP